MGEMTKIRERLKRAKEIKIWFWDGMREYEGIATRLTTESVDGYLKISELGDQTVIPGPAMLEGIIRHLTNRDVDMKLTGQNMEVQLKATVIAVARHTTDERRATLSAAFKSPNEKQTGMLQRLANA